MPVSMLVTEVQKQFGPERYFIWPTLCWLNSSDTFLRILCGGGEALACLLILGIFPGPILILLWAAYLSLVVAGQDFLSFQWDCLLLEAGFISIFFAPWGPWPRLRNTRSSRDPALASQMATLPRHVLVRNSQTHQRRPLLARLHRHAIPLLDPAHPHLDKLVHRPGAGLVSALFRLGCYLRRGRPAAFLFRPAKIAPLRHVRNRLLPTPHRRHGQLWIFQSPHHRPVHSPCRRFILAAPLEPESVDLALDSAKGWRLWPVVITIPLSILILVITLKQGIDAVGWQVNWPASLQAVDDAIEPFRTINSYGLFRVMTTQRNEIIIEGSDDGQTWKEYQFEYKPGDVNRAPVFTTPHMPRLDWQMWFAALSDAQSNPWFENFMIRLLEGSPPVVKLLAYDPFPDHPPRYVRAVMYDYHFTTFQERKATGAWWTRKELGLYFPSVSLNQ